MKHSIPLDDSEVHWDKVKMESIDLTGDKVKDLIIYRISEGASDGGASVSIISWQYGLYTEVGTFPPLNLDDSNKKDESILLGSKVWQNQKKFFEAKQRGEKTKLNWYLISFRPKFIDIDYDGNNELVVYRPVYRVDESKGDAHNYRVEVYKPYMKENVLLWYLKFSGYTPIKTNSQKYLDDFLMERY